MSIRHMLYTPLKVHRQHKKLAAGALALLSFAAGSFLTLQLMRVREVRADANRVFELRIYHAVPGKVPKLEARFADASPLIAKYGLNVVGYWVPEQVPEKNQAAWSNTFVYLLAHESREEAKKNWHAFHADPQFQKYLQSERAEKLIEDDDAIFMRPSDFSAMK